MDNNKLKELIKEVAEIKELKPVTSGERPADGVTEVIYKGEWIELDKKTNPTLGFKFVKLKGQGKTCELGCGRYVVGQIIERRLITYPDKHWRTRCNTCGKFVGPDGKTLIKGGHDVQSEFMKHFRNKE